MKVINYMAIGLAVGFVFTTFFMVMFMGVNEITVQVLAWMIASIGFGVSSLIFEAKSLSLFKASIIHYTVCLLIAGVNMYLFYTDYLITALLSFTITYVIMYVSMWQIEKQKVKQINEKLRR